MNPASLVHRSNPTPKRVKDLTGPLNSAPRSCGKRLPELRRVAETVERRRPARHLHERLEEPAAGKAGVASLDVHRAAEDRAAGALEVADRPGPSLVAGARLERERGIGDCQG